MALSSLVNVSLVNNIPASASNNSGALNGSLLPDVSFYTISGNNDNLTDSTTAGIGFGQNHHQHYKDIQQVSIFPNTTITSIPPPSGSNSRNNCDISISTNTGDYFSNYHRYNNQRHNLSIYPQISLSYQSQRQTPSSSSIIGSDAGTLLSTTAVNNILSNTSSSGVSSVSSYTNRFRSLLHQQSNKTTNNTLISATTQRTSQTNQLKLKSRRARVSSHIWTIHSICLCQFSARFPHTIYQHQRFKLDNFLRSSSSLSSLSNHPSLINNPLIDPSFAMGQKVSSIASGGNGGGVPGSLNHSTLTGQNKVASAVMRESVSSTLNSPATINGTPFTSHQVHNSHNHNQSPQPISSPATLSPLPDPCSYHFSICPSSFDDEPERPARLDSLLDLPPVSLDIQKQHGWNENDRSLNIIVVENDPRIVHRHPVAQSTDCVRGLVGYSKGLHVWEIKWPLRQRGTHAVVGVATIEAALHSNGYHPLVGATAESWGWDLGRNLLYHDLKSQNYGRTTSRDNNSYGKVYNHQFVHDPQFVAPESFLVVLDMDKGTLAFMANGQYLGVAFDDGLKGKTLYPIISSVWGHCEITMRYINGLNRK